MLYGAAWAISATSSLCRGGVIAPPKGVRGALVFAVSLLLGQMVLYYLGADRRHCMFWCEQQRHLAHVLLHPRLASGVFVPLPFMPASC